MAREFQQIPAADFVSEMLYPCYLT